MNRYAIYGAPGYGQPSLGASNAFAQLRIEVEIIGSNIEILGDIGHLISSYNWPDSATDTLYLSTEDLNGKLIISFSIPPNYDRRRNYTGDINASLVALIESRDPSAAINVCESQYLPEYPMYSSRFFSNGLVNLPHALIHQSYSQMVDQARSFISNTDGSEAVFPMMVESAQPIDEPSEPPAEIYPIVWGPL